MDFGRSTSIFTVSAAANASSLQIKPSTGVRTRSRSTPSTVKAIVRLTRVGRSLLKTLNQYHRPDLGMSALRFDIALFCLLTIGLLTGLSGDYVDDLTRTVNESFKKLSRKKDERFEMPNGSSIPCSFTGSALQHNAEGEVVQRQHEHLHKLDRLPDAAVFLRVRSMRVRPTWLANTRPNCLLEISQLAQITEETFQSSNR